MAEMDRDFTQSGDGGASHSYSSVGTMSPSNRLVLHIGVIDIPYSNTKSPKKIPKAKKGKNARPIKEKVESGTQSTGDVAGWLENKYGVMQTFADQQLPGVAAELEESLAGVLENMMMGAPTTGNPFASAESNITQMFKTYLAEGEIEHAGVSGVPTEAALKGVNHRLKSNRGGRRPSFIDTGLYQQSAVVWME